MAQEVGSWREVEDGEVRGRGPAMCLEAITELEEKSRVWEPGRAWKARSWGGTDALLLFFVPPAGSRRHVVSPEAPARRSFPSAASPAGSPCISCWSPGPADHMNVAGIAPLSTSCPPRPVGLGSALQRLTHTPSSPFPFHSNPSPSLMISSRPSPSLLTCISGEHAGPALPALEGEAGCLKHEAQGCHCSGEDPGTREGRD